MSSPLAVPVPEAEEVRPAHLSATEILDHESAEIRALLNQLTERLGKGSAPRAFVQAAHHHLSSSLRAVYSIDDARPTSKTLRKNGGSCAQRMACVESLARAFGVATRVRALRLKKEFWSYRIPLLQPVMPPRTLMPWPQFFLESRWVDFDEIYASPRKLVAQTPRAFSNRGESLFDAVRHAPVDFLGKTASFSSCDISHFVAEDVGFFDTRDEVMKAFDESTWLGHLIFNLTYGGRSVRREVE